MVIRWGMLWSKSRKPLKTAWLITAGLLALYVGFVEPRNSQRGIASERAAGLASTSSKVAWEPIWLWRQASILPSFASKVSVDKGVVGGVPGGSTARMMVRASLGRVESGGGGGGGDREALNTEDRKLVRTATLGLIVKSPTQSVEKIIRLAQSAGGFLVTSQINGRADAPSASLTIRVPASKFDAIREQIRQLSLRVDSESVEAQDVTKQYVDDEARLRNLRAEEQHYLAILRKAATVKDTLEVSDKLNEVRGEIEEKQAEFEALSKQVETVALNIALYAEADAQVFGLHWRPLYQLKIAAREGLDGLGDYAASMAVFVFYVPTILLWLFTILAGAALGWRVLRWAARRFFRCPKADPSQPVA